MRRSIALLAGALLFAAVSRPNPAKEPDPGTVQTGSTLMGCLEEAGMGGYIIADGAGEGVMVLSADGKLDEHAGHWVKLDGDSFMAGGIEHFRVRTVTPMVDSCDSGFEDSFGLEASATLENAQGETVGRAKLRQVSHGVLLEVIFENMPPGRHALHIHGKGACEAPDFKSAGGHFNPSGATHGYFAGKTHHAGDMPNFEVPESGKITLERVNSRLTLTDGRRNSLFGAGGTALVVHSDTDDYESQPSGDAGERIACGTIERVD